MDDEKLEGCCQVNNKNEVSEIGQECGLLNLGGRGR